MFCRLIVILCIPYATEDFAEANYSHMVYSGDPCVLPFFSFTLQLVASCSPPVTIDNVANFILSGEREHSPWRGDTRVSVNVLIACFRRLESSHLLTRHGFSRYSEPPLFSPFRGVSFVHPVQNDRILKPDTTFV